MSENVVSAEIDEQVVSTRVSLDDIEVFGKVMLGDVSPNRFEVSTQTPMRNLDRTKIIVVFD